jgi:hypothetical protein
MTGGLDGNEDEEARGLRKMMEFLLGMGGGPKGDGMPREVFREVLNFLMPSWDPLRVAVAGAGPQLQG